MPNHPSSLSDNQVIQEIKTRVSNDCKSLAELLSLLAEMDDRRLYAQLGRSSLFDYMTKSLHFSEGAAYKRIHAARAARDYPVILPLIAAGKVNLTTIND